MSSLSLCLSVSVPISFAFFSLFLSLPNTQIMNQLAQSHLTRSNVPPAAFDLMWTSVEEALCSLLLDIWEEELDTGDGVWNHTLGDGQLNALLSLSG